MLNLNKRTKTKPKPKPTLIFKNCSCVSACRCAQLSYTTQHRTVLITFCLILQTVIIAQLMSTGGEELPCRRNFCSRHVTFVVLNSCNRYIDVAGLVPWSCSDYAFVDIILFYAFIADPRSLRTRPSTACRTKLKLSLSEAVLSGQALPIISLSSARKVFFYSKRSDRRPYLAAWCSG